MYEIYGNEVCKWIVSQFSVGINIGSKNIPEKKCFEIYNLDDVDWAPTTHTHAQCIE